MNNWPQVQSFFWERSPFFRLLLPFIAGIIYYDSFALYTVAPASWIITSSVCIAIAFALHQIRKTIPRRIADLLVFVSIFFFATGIQSIQDVRTCRHWMGNTMAQTNAWEAVIAAPPLEKERTYKLALNIEQAIQNGVVAPASGKAFLYVYKDSLPFSVQEGDHILLRNNMQLISNPGNPFEMDYAHYAARNHIYHQQFSGRADITVTQKNLHTPFLKKCHNWCQLQLTRYIPDAATLSILQAMLIGDEAYLDDELRQAYAQTGIIHIISISGSHVAIFFLLISGMLWWLRHKKYTVIKYVLAIGPVWFYVLMAGSPPSAIRAAVMFTILAIGQLLQRSNNPFNTLMTAAFILLVIDPAWLFSVGFQLSFIAVLSLIIFYKPIAHLWQPKNKIAGKLWQAAAASIAAEILVAPLVIYYFHSFPAMFLLANIVAYLLISILLVAGMCILIFAWFPWLAKCIAAICILITTIFNKAIDFLQHFSPASLSMLQLSLAEIVLLYGITGFIAVWLLQKKRNALWGGLSLACVFAALLCTDEWKTTHQRTLVVYNIGRINYAELFDGKKISALCNDSMLPVKSAYTLHAAHTGFQATEKDTNAAPVTIIHGKRVLLLSENMHDTARKFPVDVLVLLHPLKKLSFTAVRQIFHPSVMVIPSGQSKWYARQWKDSCAQYHIAAHYTATDGAYVMENN